MLSEIQGCAKLSRPNAAGAFPRKRLFSLLKGKAGSPVVWISAPAGSGKTTLVSSWIDFQKSPWMQKAGSGEPKQSLHPEGA